MSGFDSYAPRQTRFFKRIVVGFSDEIIIFNREITYERGVVNFLRKTQDVFLAWLDVKKAVRTKRFSGLHVSILIYVALLPFNRFGVNFWGYTVKFTEIALLGVVVFGCLSIVRRYFTEDKGPR